MASARQHVPIQEYKSNLQSMIQHIQSIGTKNILLIAPPPVDEPSRIRHNKEVCKFMPTCCSQTIANCKSWKVSSVMVVHAQNNGDSEATSIPERTNEFTGQYVAAARQLAGELSLPVVDLWTEVQKQKGWQSKYLEDGLHFTPAGQKAVFDLLLDAIRKALPHLRFVDTIALLPLDVCAMENLS